MWRFFVILWVWSLVSLSVCGQELWVVHSKNLNRADSTWVFVPANAGAEKLPVVILLHGYGGKPRAFGVGLDLARLADSLRIVFVCPDGLFDSWYFDSKFVPGSNYEQFFFADFLPQLLRQFPTDAKRVCIDGFSMGGHGAVFLASRHPDLFLAAGSISGTLDLEFSGLRNTSLSKHLGAYNRKIWWPFMAIAGLTNLHTVPLIVSCGLSDPLLPASRRFVEQAHKQGIMPTYIEAQGKHDGRFVASQIMAHIHFFESHF
jgi:S-formylglutathione hydrolase FrmB